MKKIKERPSEGVAEDNIQIELTHYTYLSAINLVKTAYEDLKNIKRPHHLLPVLEN